MRYIFMKFILLLFIILFSCKAEPDREHQIDPVSDKLTEQQEPVQSLFNPKGSTVESRIRTLDNYQRVAVVEDSYEQYLRKLPLKPDGSSVQYYNGGVKSNYNTYCAVVDLPIGKENLHQCADAIMRLRAEYLWRSGQYDQIHFNLTNGFTVEYSEWMKGRRMIVEGNRSYWDDGRNPSNSYEDFWNYMELIFMYAGTASLENELVPLEGDEAEIGDILIQGGFPGHAVIIVDKARHEESGDLFYLLAQSYMPAQEIQVLQNPMDSKISPWYEFKDTRIETPEWIFYKEDLRSF